MVFRRISARPRPVWLGGVHTLVALLVAAPLSALVAPVAAAPVPADAPAARPAAQLAVQAPAADTASTLSAASTATAVQVPEGFSDQQVLGGLAQPTAAVFAPGGRVFIGEKSGIVKTYDSLADGTPTVVADLRDEVHDFWDRGLLGLALDPHYPARPYLYALYSYNALPGATHPKWSDERTGNDSCPSPPGATADGCVITGRLAKLTLDGSGIATGKQNLITDWCQQYPSHSIGTVTFGPDGALYVGGGDGASFTFTDYGQRGNPCGDPPQPAGTDLSTPTSRGGALRSQSPRRPGMEPRTLDGAILRVSPDTGAGMPGNPFAGSGDANARRIIAYGMRNQFRFGFRPGTRELWVGDVGWRQWEEINRIPDATDGVAENFGWPCYEGSGKQAGYDGADLNQCESLYSGGGHAVPFYAYDHSASVVGGDGCPTGGSAISGIAFEEGSDFPAAYRGALFFADSSRKCIWAMQVGAGGRPDPGKLVALATGVPRPVQLLSGPGGDLYYIAFDTGELRRIGYTSGNRAPTADASATPTSGPAPLTVRFDGSASSDPDPGDVLRYAWDLDGDGAFDDSADVRPEYTYVAAGRVDAGLRVTDQVGASDTVTVTIDVGAPDDSDLVVTIEAPTSALTWQVGQSVEFSGRADDPEDGALPPSALSWRLSLQHCSSPGICHGHTVRDFDGIASGSFDAPDHDYPSYLQLTLTARDSDGNAASETVRLDPETVVLDFATNPSGLDLVVGDTVRATPFSTTVIVGSATSVSAPNPQNPGDYWFTGWSDEGARAREIIAAATPTEYEASYVTCTVDGTRVPDCGGPAPSAPRDLDAVGEIGAATVSWQRPYWPGVDGLTKYRVSVDDGRTFDVDPDVTSLRVTGLGTATRNFTVDAFSASGPGPAVGTALIGVSADASASPGILSFGEQATISGVLTDTDSGSGLAGLAVELWARPISWRGGSTLLDTRTTDAGGAVEFVRRPGQPTAYELRFSGDADRLGAAASAAVYVRRPASDRPIIVPHRGS